MHPERRGTDHGWHRRWPCHHDGRSPSVGPSGRGYFDGYRPRAGGLFVAALRRVRGPAILQVDLTSKEEGHPAGAVLEALFPRCRARLVTAADRAFYLPAAKVGKPRVPKASSDVSGQRAWGSKQKQQEVPPAKK